jgi:hypothetical protein
MAGRARLRNREIIYNYSTKVDIVREPSMDFAVLDELSTHEDGDQAATYEALLGS